MQRIGAVPWVVVLVFALGCQPAAPPPAPTARPAEPAAAAPTAVSAAPAPAPTTGGMPAPLNPPVVVRIGVIGSVADSGVFVALERGYFRELGLELELELSPDPNATGQLVASNRLDVGGYGVNANPFMVAGRGIGVKMVADKGKLRPGFGFSQAIVRQDLWESGELRTHAQLRGRTIARLAPCDAHDPVIEHLLEPAGLTRGDIEAVTMSFPDMNVALANKAVDLAIQLEPLATLAIERGIASRFATGDEIYPNQQIAALYYSPDFAARTDASQRFMVGYVRGVRAYNDAFAKGIGREDVAQILAKHTTVKDLALYDRILPAGLDPDGRLNVQGVRDDVALYGRLGCLTGEVADVGRVIDESFVNYAVGVLGPYQP